MTYNYDKYSYHYKTLLSLGLPLIVGQVGTIVLGFADTLMVGHHSVNELAAASFVNTVMSIVLVFALGFSYGLTPIIGRLFGRGDSREVGAVVSNGLYAATTTAGILLAVLLAVFFNIERMGQPAELIPLMCPYMVANMVSLPFVCWFNTFKQFFDTIGHTKTSMYIMVGGNVANILGNYVLIYGHWGLPEMGLLGAGSSTMSSRILMFIAAAAIYFLIGRYSVYSRATRETRFCRRDFLGINRVSWPVAIQMGMEAAAFALTGVMAGWLGTTALATHQIMITISQLFFMVYYGITAAVSVRVSFYIGQNDIKELRKVAAAGFHIVLLIGCIVCVPVLLLRNDMGYWFADSPAVASLCAEVILIMIVYQFGDGLQMVYANALRGTGYVKPMMYIAFFSYFVISLPISYVFGISLGYGIVGIWSAFPVCLTIAAFLYLHFFRKKVRMLEGE